MKIGHIIVPAGDLDAQLAFYGALGLTTKFRDGDRYAALTDGSVTIGLADASQQPVPGQVVLTVQVDDLDALLVDRPEIPVEVGPHERRAVLTDPAGNPVVLYERLPS
ncbi:VOC family protein [Dactylosporangium sp. CS-033363]|uniref:VOC family protein n=1 Tax=Dactylosporangium sp. CS-033363 TaxID=3239935 RepID=UPI003D8F8B1D